jgi:putative peptidoglycan lipid II flippase
MNDGSRQVARAATLVMALFVFSRALGLVRQMVIGALFGTSAALDAYLAAARIPELIFMVVAGGALGSAFIPAFTAHLAKGDRAGAWQLASAIVNLALIVLTAAAVLMIILAPALVRTAIAPGFDQPQQTLTVRLMRLMLISPIIFGVSGIVMGALNAHQHFLLPALAPSIYNISIIGGAVLLGPRIGVMGLAVGVVVGAGLHLLIQTPALLRYGAHYVPTLGLGNASVREVARLMAPRMAGTAIAQLNFVVNNSLATGLGEGAVSAINFAWLLLMLPLGVLAQAVGTAAFPTLAAQVARGEHEKMRNTLSGTLRAVFALCLPATMGLLVLGRPLVALLFERGAFEATSTDAVTWALTFYTVGLIGHAGLEIIARAFYALHDTATPVLVGGLAMGVNVTLSLTLPGLFGSLGWPNPAGLALANSIATLIELVVLIALIRRRMSGIEGRQTLPTIVKSGIASLGMGAVLVGWRAALPDAGAVILGGGGIILGMGAYLVGALLLRMEEVQVVLKLIRRRLA